ncbi:MAG TPA: acyl-CoA thioesterase [Deltaproteobacteria bacterium]|nr:MAG: hypothetical protein DRG59_06185 [Deltaproteobacteria bacterium]HDM76197.1 acyl-CoA thioesterase [Deltaproteobacteria bacterium]
MIDTVVKVPIFVRFGDTDPYGVVYFVSYFRYCHWGIEEFLRSLGLEPNDIFRNREEKFGLPVVGAKCDFYKPVWYGQKLELHVSLKQVKSKVVVFNFEFYRPPEEAIIAKGEATLVAIGADWKSRELPDVLRSRIE